MIFIYLIIIIFFLQGTRERLGHQDKELSVKGTNIPFPRILILEAEGDC